MADIAVGRRRVADVEQPARRLREETGQPCAARIGAPEQLDRRCDTGKYGPPLHQVAEMARQRRLRRRSYRGPSRAASRAVGRAPADRVPAAAARSSCCPSRRACAMRCTMFGGAAINTSTSSISRKPSSPGIASAAHGTLASRALGETNSAARGDATSRSTAAMRVRRAVRSPGRVRSPTLRDGDANGPVAIARSTASRWVSEPCGSGSACASSSSAATRVGSSTTQVTVRDGCPTTRRLA